MKTDHEPLHVEAKAPGEVCLTRLLPGPIERVWAYLTDSEKRGKWLAPGLMEQRPGGRVKFHFNNDKLAPHEGTVLEATEETADDDEESVWNGAVRVIEPPHRLVLTWEHGEGNESEVTFELTPQGSQVLLVITHRGVKDPGMFLSVAAGWQTHTGILADHLEGKTPRPFWIACEAFKEEYRRRFTEKGLLS